MSLKRKEYKVNEPTKKVTHFFLVCKTNPPTSIRLLIPATMRARGYSDDKAADQILVQQMHCESQKNKVKNTPCAKTVAAAAMLILSNTTNVVRLLLAMITPIMATSSVALGGILPPPPRKMRKTSYQEQINHQNKQKRKVVYNQAHTHTTTLVTKMERLKEKENQRTAAQAIKQVEGELRMHGYSILLSTTTIN